MSSTIFCLILGPDRSNQVFRAKSADTLSDSYVPVEMMSKFVPPKQRKSIDDYFVPNPISDYQPPTQKSPPMPMGYNSDYVDYVTAGKIASGENLDYIPIEKMAMANVRPTPLKNLYLDKVKSVSLLNLKSQVNNPTVSAEVPMRNSVVTGIGGMSDYIKVDGSSWGKPQNQPPYANIKNANSQPPVPVGSTSPVHSVTSSTTPVGQQIKTSAPSSGYVSQEDVWSIRDGMTMSPTSVN